MRHAGMETSNPTIEKLGDFHLRMLMSEKETESIVGDFKAIHEAYIHKWRQLKDTEFEMKVKNGRLRNEDISFDENISLLNQHLLINTKNNRSSDIYRTFFPEGTIAETVKAPFSYASITLKRIKTGNEKYPDLFPDNIIPELETITANINELINEVKESGIKISELKTELTILKLNWIRVYNYDELKLLTIFENKKKRANNFFLTL